MSDKDNSGLGCLVVIVLVGLGFYQCSKSPAEVIPERSYESRLEDARIDAAADISGTTYQDYMGSSGCTDDCGGHDAGWTWADDNGVTDASDCGGSGSFYEGCAAFAEQIEEQAQEEAPTYDE